MQFAICYVNLAIPSTAARVAINVRFFQRFGVKPTEAMTAGVIDSVSGFIVQIALFLGLFFVSDIDLGLSFDTGELSGAATIALIALGRDRRRRRRRRARRPLRRRVVAVFRQARVALGVLRRPTKVLQLFIGNVVCQVLFAVALSACAEAFGQHVPLAQLVLINTVVSLFAGLLPIPGGIGVTEAGLTYGLSAAGLSSETAFTIADRLPLLQLLPAPDLGLVLLPLARQAPLPVGRAQPDPLGRSAEPMAQGSWRRARSPAARTRSRLTSMLPSSQTATTPRTTRPR